MRAPRTWLKVVLVGVGLRWGFGGLLFAPVSTYEGDEGEVLEGRRVDERAGFGGLHARFHHSVGDEECG